LGNYLLLNGTTLTLQNPLKNLINSIAQGFKLEPYSRQLGAGSIRYIASFIDAVVDFLLQFWISSHLCHQLTKDGHVFLVVNHTTQATHASQCSGDR
jgi:hypothetical protein